MITLKNITLMRGGKILLDHVDVAIFAKQKVGIVGLNGSGKSSLFSLLLKKLSPDSGELYIQSNIRISYLSQELSNTEISALQYVINGDQELSDLICRLKKAEDSSDDHLITLLHNRLYELGGYDLESRAAKLLVGLGFKIEEQQKTVTSFSGGWRMRLNLAQVLMSRADLLLLDEPTNYLDLDAIVWLERWLQNYSGTLLLISHDRDFLDNVIEKTIYIGNSKLESYAGDYSSFERQRAEHLLQEKSLYEKQKGKIEHLNKYINRFRAKASKARQAQSRIKALEKMEMVSITRINTPFSFQFYKTKPCGAPLLSMKKVDVAYGDHKVLNKINFNLNPNDSIGILGINGAGKSTFMKTLARILDIKAGELFFSHDLRIGYFAQHQIDQLDMQASPINIIKRVTPEAQEQKIRSFLGGFGFCSNTVFKPIANFSGGEKARLVLAMLIWQKPNLLLLDEPTNHLDLEMRETLTYALQDYDGALVLVAHDRYLLKAVVDEFYLVDDCKVTKFDGDLDDYEKWLFSIRKKQLVEGKSIAANGIIKDRESSKVSTKQAQILEKDIKKLNKEKERITKALSDPNIYQQDNKLNVEKHLKQNASIEKKIKELEKRWFELHSDD